MHKYILPLLVIILSTGFIIFFSLKKSNIWQLLNDINYRKLLLLIFNNNYNYKIYLKTIAVDFRNLE